MVDGFLIMANAVVSAVKLDNFTEIGPVLCYTVNVSAWDSGTTVRKRALEVS